MYKQTHLCSHIQWEKTLLYILFMAPCNIIIIIKCYDGTSLPHIKNHGTQFKTHNTHFLHTIHTTLRYIADFSYLKPILCIKKG